MPGKEALDEVLDAFHHLVEPRATKFKSKGRDRGINRASLLEPWNEVATWVLKYFFCEGQYATLQGHQMRLLVQLRHPGDYMYNIPEHLYDSLQAMASKWRESKQTSPLKHHGLITMIC